MVEDVNKNKESGEKDKQGKWETIKEVLVSIFWVLVCLILLVLYPPDFLKPDEVKPLMYEGIVAEVTDDGFVLGDGVRVGITPETTYNYDYVEDVERIYSEEFNVGNYVTFEPDRVLQGEDTYVEALVIYDNAPTNYGELSQEEEDYVVRYVHGTISALVDDGCIQIDLDDTYKETEDLGVETVSVFYAKENVLLDKDKSSLEVGFNVVVEYSGGLVPGENPYIVASLVTILPKQ